MNTLLQNITAVSALIGGLWALWIFVLQRRFVPQIEFEVDAKLFRYSASEHIAEFTLTLRNKGPVRHKVRNLVLSVRGLKPDDCLSDWKDHGKQLSFPISILSRERVFPEEWEFSFVEPGIEQKYVYVSGVPAELAYLLIHGQFDYRRDWPHTAAKVIDTKITAPSGYPASDRIEAYVRDEERLLPSLRPPPLSGRSD